MARPQAVARDLGGTVAEYLPTAIGATPLVEIAGGDGTIYVASRTPDVVDAVATTITAAANMGARTLSVPAAAGFIAGRQYRLGPATGEYAEAVKVRAYSATTVTLSRPTRNPYPSGTAIVGIYVACAVTALEANALFWDGVATWSGAGLATPIQTSVQCVLHPIRKLSNMETVAGIYPRIGKLIDAETDAEELSTRAFDEVLLEIGAKFRYDTMRGSTFAQAPTDYKTVLIAGRAVGWSAEELAIWEAGYRAALDTALGNFSADLNQDGSVTPDEAPRTSVRLFRCS